MALNVTLRNAEIRVGQLENLRQASPETADNAVNELQQISGQISAALNGHQGNIITPNEMIFVQNLMGRVEALGNRFNKQTSISIALAKMREIVQQTD